MKFSAFLALLLFWSASIQGQTPEKYSRVEINLKNKDIHTLTRLGIETDHGTHAPGQWLVADLSASEIQLVQNAGFETTIRIDDLKKDYLEKRQNPRVADREGVCGGSVITPYQTPSNYTYGSMGGYHTLDEMMAVLDDMRAKFPNLITARTAVSDTIETWEGRKLWYVKISDNPDAEENEPEVLYTSLHHAREPNSASQMLFYMWYLLENYQLDPEIKYIVENAELYFIPCINPDGYVYNEINEPDGGGFWRKNRRDNGDGTFGVDLNRNYGYFWGNDDNGSSPNTQSATYRGPAAFSEPESRSIRDFCLAHDFVFALNYHTFSNLLIYPWAYNNELADPSLAVFGDLFTRENRYKNGTAIETVGYNVNGSSDDWMFAAKGTNSYTPEVGLTGFWPQPDEIDDLNRENMWQNIATALCALRYGEVKDVSARHYSNLNPQIDLEITRYGYEDGMFLLNVFPLSNNINDHSVSAGILELEQFETQTATISVNLNPSIQIGNEFSLVVQFSNGFYVQWDTLRKVYGGKTVEAFNENGDEIIEWSGTWQQTPDDFVSPPYSITDSPDGNYDNLAYTFLDLSPGINIPANAELPQLRFWAKWDIEPDYDYAQVRALSFTQDQALCGRYTVAPSANGAQPVSDPIFEGFQGEWVEECMDLGDFIGEATRIRFILASDNGDERDGFYFDDLRIEYVDPTLLKTVSIPLRDFRLQQNTPNPTAGSTLIRWDNPGQLDGPAVLQVYNVLGEKVASRPLDLNAQNEIRLDTRNWPAGVYTYFLQTGSRQTPALKMTVGK
jgi:hypothetical protein